MMSYREAAPTAENFHLVLSFWEFSVGNEATLPLEHEVFPDGCISIFYYRNVNFNAQRFLICGISLESVKTPIFAGDTIWGMRIQPAACSTLLRCNPAKIKTHPLPDFPHLLNSLAEEFDTCKDFQTAITIYERILKAQNLRPADLDEKVAKAVEIIESLSGEIKISELAAKVNLSVRQFERRFKNSAGLTPKQFVRARRIRATAVSLVEETSLTWATRAAEKGFTDQAHLTHEFVAVTGRSPNSFAEKVKRIEHGPLIK